jgi:hypothetical protein
VFPPEDGVLVHRNMSVFMQSDCIFCFNIVYDLVLIYIVVIYAPTRYGQCKSVFMFNDTFTNVALFIHWPLWNLKNAHTINSTLFLCAAAKHS